MKNWMKFLFLLSCLVPFFAQAQITPLPVDQDTVGLWNFDTDVGDQVIDIGPGPINGTAYTTEHLAVPDIDSAFFLGRKFSAQSSFVDLGVVQGTKLDFTGADEFSVEAVIHLTQSASGNHIIFSSENTRLMIVNNQLAGYVRQPGGLFGVVSSTTLSLNTTYRVGVHYQNQFLALSTNGRIAATVKLDHPISAPQFSNSRASIGGDLFARFIPGFVDDLRVRDIVGIDIQGPGIVLVEPAGFQVTVPKPSFLINLSDDISGVDAGSIQVYLNGILQPSISRTASQISGTLDDEMSTSVLNEVKVIVSDLQGNINEKTFFFSYASILNRQEYQADSFTLGLWHMNDFAPGFMKDDSGNGRDGYGDPAQILPGEGVFGQGRQIVRGGQISFDSIRFDKKFTFEGWFRTESDGSDEEVLFYNGQLKVVRFNSGYIRVVLYTTRGEKSYVSPAVLLPVGELHHLAVTWDGTKANQNLFFYVDGFVRGQLDAIYDCDFDRIPKLGFIGQNYSGLIDELRFSNTPRVNFSIPVFDNQVINFLNLKNGTSVNTEFPEFHATLNSSTTINTATAKINLNGVIQAITPELIITPSGIDGKFTSPLNPGLNTLEISFLDGHGNQRKKTQYFYLIKKDGGAEYTVDASTSGLWHFNELTSGFAQDSSGNGNHFESAAINPDQGSIGLAGRGTGIFNNKMPLNCRSFTIEGQFKSHNQTEGFHQLYAIHGNTYNQYARLNPSNGNIQLYFNSSSTWLDTEIPQAVPVDNAFHHIALVYDGSRSYSQLLLVVDGEVKRALDFQNSCDFTGSNTFTFGADDKFSVDELRVSTSARYGFNLQKEVSDRPSFVSSNASPGSTVHSPNLNFTFIANDSDGINIQNTKLFVNGVEQQVTSTQKMGRPNLETSFSSDVVLIGGANLFTVKMQDMRGNDEVKSFYIYLFAEQASAEYQPDPETLFLFHLNETTGDFADSSSNGFSIPAEGWVADLEGVFGRAVSNQIVSGSPINLGNLSNRTGYTFETWRKGFYPAEYYVFFGSTLVVGFDSSGNFMAIINSIKMSQQSLPVTDNNYHHYAVVVDTTHPHQDVYILVDGNVAYSTKADSDLNLGNLDQSVIGNFLYDTSIDELRFSSVPRYEMVFKPN